MSDVLHCHIDINTLDITRPCSRYFNIVFVIQYLKFHLIETYHRGTYDEIIILQILYQYYR